MTLTTLTLRVTHKVQYLAYLQVYPGTVAANLDTYLAPRIPTYCTFHRITCGSFMTMARLRSYCTYLGTM